MEPDLARSAAVLWKRILLKDPAQVFGAELSHLLQRNWGDRIAQPGYVGRQYSLRGLAFVSMNPGGGPNQGLGPNDLAQYEIVQRLRDSAESATPGAFLELTTLLERLMPTWRICKNFVLPVLQYANLDFTRVSYLNLLKWRTKSSSG